MASCWKKFDTEISSEVKDVGGKFFSASIRTSFDLVAEIYYYYMC
jgi:hypothetical protein